MTALGQEDMSRWSKPKFEDICAADYPSKVWWTSLRVKQILNNKPAWQAFKCLKKVKILEDGDPMVLDIYHLHAVITVTAKTLKRNPPRKDQEGTEKVSSQTIIFSR